jgi:hypothetical protein
MSLTVGYLRKRLSGYSDDLEIKFATCPGDPGYEIASIYNPAELKEGQENVLWVDLEPIGD